MNHLPSTDNQFGGPFPVNMGVGGIPNSMAMIQALRREVLQGRQESQQAMLVAASVERKSAAVEAASIELKEQFQAMQKQFHEFLEQQKEPSSGKVRTTTNKGRKQRETEVEVSFP